MPEGDGNKPERPEPPRPGGPNMRMPSRGIVSWMMFLALALLLVVMLTKSMQPVDKITITDFEKLVQNKEIEKLTIRESVISGTRTRSERDEPTATLEFDGRKTLVSQPSAGG